MFELLKIAPYGQSEVIDIALGKYKLPTSLREGLQQIKREIKAKKR